MGGFPGPKRSFLVAIILAIALDQVERDQGGTWKGRRARRIRSNTAKSRL